MTLNVVVDNDVFPRPSQFFGTVAAVRNVYYGILFATDPAYRGSHEPWVRWSEIGFDHMVKEPLRCAQPSDRLHLTTHSNFRKIEFSALADNPDALRKTSKVLAAISEAKKSVQHESDEDRYEALCKNESIATEFVEPLTEALERGGLRMDEKERVLQGVLRDCLVTLTHRNVLSISTSISN